ncbi:MAG: hydrogenase maturation protein HypF [Comamonadaceae bacterium]|nr:MAG: hydrogenase maturation protein HypF [Comamonadaceae bacterium]
MIHAHIRVTGQVQGVGFRPFVFKLAHELGLVGWVCNDSEGVEIAVEGEPAQVMRLIERLQTEPQGADRHGARHGHLSGLPQGNVGPG